MAPKLVMNQKRHNIPNSLTIKKLNQYTKINVRLQKRIEELSSQNKELSTDRNNLLLDKLELENENRSLKNSNHHLQAMHRTIQNKVNVLQQTLQKCVPALVTMSQCVPDMLINLNEIGKFNINEINNKEKKERQTKTVRPMINGMTINQPAVSLSRFDMSPLMSPIIESPNSEHTPKRSRRTSNRNSIQCKLNLEPYVRLKDVAVLFKNSKSVSNENSQKRQLNESFGEGPSWLHSPRNQNQNSENICSVTESKESSTPVLNETSTSIERETLPVSEVQVQTNMSTYASSSNDNMSVTFNQTDLSNIQNNDSTSESTMLKNITCRKRPTRSQGETSVSISDINDSVSSQTSQRSRRSKTKEVNYKEPKLKTKLRRN